MNIIIDGNRIDAEVIAGSNLEEILEALQTSVITRERLVGEVLVNGESYSEDLPHAAAEVQRSGIETLELVTHSIEEIARHFLKNGEALIDSLLQSLPRIVEMFRLGDEIEASEHFLRFLESLHLLIGMLQQSGQALGLNADTVFAGHGSYQSHMQTMAEILTRLLSVQEQNDWVYLADIIEYDLTPELKEVRDLLPLLLQAEPGGE